MQSVAGASTSTAAGTGCASRTTAVLRRGFEGGDLNDSSRWVECEGNGNRVVFRFRGGDAYFGVAIGGADLGSAAFRKNCWAVDTVGHTLWERGVVTASRGGENIAENSEVAIEWSTEPKVRFSKRPNGGNWESLYECDTKLSAADFTRLLPVVWLWYDWNKSGDC